MKNLRPYQSAAIDAIRAKLREGKKRLVLIAPTGSGKTVVATHMIDRAVSRGKRVLFVAHRDLLIQQASDRLAEHGISSGIIMASHPAEPGASVQVASIQTLARRKDWPEADLVIIDEAHHCAARTYRKLFEQYQVVIGLTATPWRMDGKGLGDLFEDSVVAATPAQLIESGDLVPYGGWVFKPPDLSGVKSLAGDYSTDSLRPRVTAIMGDVVEQWLLRSPSLKTVCFAVDIEHARLLAGRFKAAGVAAEVIHHELSNSDRLGCVDRVRSGATRVICNVGILGEGVDICDLQCAILARPTKSLSLYLQQVGRVMRPAPSKDTAVIHDHGGCMERHGLPDDERDYSLDAVRSSNAMDPVKQLVRGCEKCFALLPRKQPWPCPECGHTPEVAAQLIKERAAEALEVEEMKARRGALSEARQKRDDMEAYKRQLVEECVSKGFAAGYMVHKFLERYPHAPKPWAAYREINGRKNKSKYVRKGYGVAFADNNG